MRVSYSRIKFTLKEIIINSIPIVCKTSLRIRVREDTTPNIPNILVEKEFSWQEKHFNREQKEYYSDERNCFTDKERKYNRMICEEDQDDDFLFTYCHEDQFYPDDEVCMNFP